MEWKSGDGGGDEIKHIDLAASFCLSPIFYVRICLLLFGFDLDWCLLWLNQDWMCQLQGTNCSTSYFYFLCLFPLSFFTPLCQMMSSFPTSSHFLMGIPIWTASWVFSGKALAHSLSDIISRVLPMGSRQLPKWKMLGEILSCYQPVTSFEVHWTEIVYISWILAPFNSSSSNLSNLDVQICCLCPYLNCIFVSIE